MHKILFALFMLPVLGMLLLVGVIVESAKAQAPALAAAAAPRAMPPSRAGDAVGGPYEPAPAVSPVDEAAAALDSSGDRWRIVTDPELERRFAPPRQRRLNNVTLRF
jgi:hypothetical protein